MINMRQYTTKLKWILSKNGVPFIAIMLLEKDMLKQQLNGFGGMFPCNFVGIMVVSRYLPLTRPMTFSRPDE